MKDRTFLRSELLLLCMFLLPACADAGEVTANDVGDGQQICCALHDIAGAVRGDYFRSSKQLDDQLDFWGLTTQLKASPAFTDSAGAHIEGRVINSDIGGDGDTTGKLLEGYLSLHSTNTDVRLGKQIVAWGRADRINPTDNLTPRDYTVLLPFDEDQRLGVTALKTDWRVGESSNLSFFTTPFFEPSKVPLPSGIPFSQDVPAHRLANSEYALKLTQAGNAVDWSVSLFDGYNLLPSFAPSPSSAAIAIHYDRIAVLGADLATTLGDYGIRGEIARFWPRDAGPNPYAINPFLFFVVGMDRTYSDNLNVNVQLVGRYVSNFQDAAQTDATAALAATLTSVINGQQDRVTRGATLRVSDSWFNSTLDAELLVFVYFDHTNSYIRPRVSYEFSDRIKGSIGADLYYGPAISFFGFLKPNRGPFAELRYSF